MTQDTNDMVTKATAVVMLTQMGNVTHRSLGAGWSGVEAIVSDQEDPEVALPGLADFSLVELCLAGTMEGVNRFDGLATPAEGTYRPGAMFFAPSRRRVDCEARGSARSLQLAIGDAILNEVKAEVLSGDPDASDLLGFNAVHHPRMRFCAEALHQELLTPSAGGALMAEAMTQALCVEIVRGYSSGRVSTREPAKATLSPAQLDRALDAIEAAVPGDAGLEEIARAVGYSTFHFSRAFKAATGTSPHQVLIERRVARARERLERGDDPIVDVALECGFSSQAHMTSTFTRQLGVSPGRYRKERRR